MKKLLFAILMGIAFGSNGQSVTNFSLPNALDGKMVSLTDYSSSSGVIIIFTLNNCPFDDYYKSRIELLSKGKLPVLLVNASPEPTESKDEMKANANKNGLTIPYLADKDQTLMQNLNARKSTEVFLLQNSGGKFKIYYHGAIDDNPQVASDVKHAYLNDAIASMTSGQTMEAVDARPTGCNIRRK